jgi:membrane-bound metal-dependent hydrolase YbcI (DUF457 family)
MLTHSIPAVGVLAIIAGLGYYVFTKDALGMALLGAVVVSHALGDYVTGIKPTWPGGPVIGLQLYRNPMVDFIIEGLVIVAGWMAYRNSFPERSRSSRDVTLVLVSLLAIQLAADIIFLTTPGLKKC